MRYNEVFVGRLRKKLDPNLIQTVRGLGYCLELPDAPRHEARAKA
jgi:two-component system OmpR family response regulator